LKKHNELWKKEKVLMEKLDEYKVDVPDFPIQKSIPERIANWMFAPADIPLPEMDTMVKSAAITVFFPILAVAFTTLPILLFLVM
jgi:hypothetical protein